MRRVTTSVTEEMRENAAAAVETAARALDEAKRDRSGNLDTQLARISHAAAELGRAQAREQRMAELATEQHQAELERQTRETELGPQIDTAASGLDASSRKGRALIDAAVTAIQAVIDHFAEHDAAVAEARMMLESGQLTVRDGSDDRNGVLGNGQGIRLDGVHYPPTPPWAVARATYTKSLSVLNFDHAERRKFELYDQAHEVSLIQRSGIFAEPAAEKKRSAKHAHS